MQSNAVVKYDTYRLCNAKCLNKFYNRFDDHGNYGLCVHVKRFLRIHANMRKKMTELDVLGIHERRYTHDFFTYVSSFMPTHTKRYRFAK